MPNDVEGNRIDFFGRIFYRTVGIDRTNDEFLFELWDAFGSESAKTIQYGPENREDTHPDLYLPHLVSSHIATGMGGPHSHAPALDLDYRVVLIEHQQPMGTATLQTVAFNAPFKKVDRKLMMMVRDLFKDLNLCDDVTFPAPNNQLEVHLHFHPVNRVHVVKSTSNNHLYINRRMSWDDYEYMLTALADFDIVNPGFADFSIFREQSFLRYPGITKAHVKGPSSERTTIDLQERLITSRQKPRIPQPETSHLHPYPQVNPNKVPFMRMKS